MRGVVVVVVVLSSATPTSAARTTPRVKWTISSLKPSTSIRVSRLMTTKSTGVRKWSAAGACKLRQGRLASKANGSCTVTLRLGPDRSFGSGTFVRKFKILREASVSAYEPYAGTNAGVPATGAKTESQLVTSDGRTRHYRMFVPSNLSTGQVPLLIALHGGLGTSGQFEENSGFDNLAESNGFIVVYPDGIGNQPDGTGFQTWNGGYCCGPAQTQNVDDVGFISSLIDKLVAQFPIDSNRVFAAGHSNGGILAYRLACELSTKIAAIGVQSGSNVVSGCAPTRPVSVLHIHGTADTNMPINGGRGSGVSATDFVSAQSAVDAMVVATGCAPTPAMTKSLSDPNVSAATWSRSGTNVQVRFVTVATAPHAWMGHSAQSEKAVSYVGTPYPNFDSSRAIWSFLASHTSS